MWALGAAAANQLMLATIGMSPRSSLLGPNLTRLEAAHRDLDVGRRVALTFDDGPDPEVTPAVLDLLAEHHARASFFCIGKRADKHPDLVREIVRQGHSVENHTYHHSPFFAFSGLARLGREIDRNQEALEALTARAPIYFRPPAGVRSPLLEPVLASRGLHLATWSRRGFDTTDRNAHRVSGRLLAGLTADSILLLHDGNAARTRNHRPIVLEVLPRVLDALEERDLCAVALPHPDGQIKPEYHVSLTRKDILEP